MKRKIDAFIITFCSILIFLSMSVLIGVVSIMAFAKKNVNEAYDEKLFELAKGGSFNEYFVDAGGASYDLESYEPVIEEKISLGENVKLWTPISEIGDNVKNAFFAVEDRIFYEHHGVNVKRTVYALANSVFHFKNTFGASTITQQVIKNISGDNDITFRRKLAEIIRAYNLERTHTKDEILELYLNIVPMGENIYGVGAASEKYFGKQPNDLTVAEAATLVGITNAPTRYNPHKKHAECLGKRNDVLYAMLDFGVIDKDAYQKALNEPLIVNEYEDASQEIHSWFIETVNRDVVAALAEKFNIDDNAAQKLLARGGFKIYTTENPEIQETVEKYFYDLKNFPGSVSDGLDYSMVVCDSKNGNLLGIVGAAGEKKGNKLLNLAETPQIPGSTLKPLALYAPGINSGIINWATVFDDVPVSFSENNVEYPKNYPDIYAGLTTVSDALKLSKNTVAIRLYGLLGPERIYRSLKNDFYFDTLVRKSYTASGATVTDLAPSPLALGQLSYGVSLRNLTTAYTVFSSEGISHKSRSFVAVFDKDGNLIIDNSPSEHEVFSKYTARVMNKLLMNVTESGTASSLTLKSFVDTAGKTGTSGEDKNRMFIGYTPYLTCGIWCGYREGGKSIGYVYPSHLKIWDDVMYTLHSKILSDTPDEDVESFSVSGLVRREYCKDSGMIYSPTCLKDPRGNRIEVGYFIKGTEPRNVCTTHVLCKYDRLAEGIATDGCPEEFIEEIALIRVEGRKFPKEIFISDAEFVYRELKPGVKLPDNYDVPYFYNQLDDGEYAGRSKAKKQYNSSCYIHTA